MGVEMNPLVSIILPTYNRAVYIIDAINSVIRQTYTNWELLVIDDQSTDNTSGLVNGFKDERVILCKTETRLGVTGTRNEGLRRSKGELIAFIDSDDLWAPAKLERQMDSLKKYPDAGFCLTGGYSFKKINEPLEFFYRQKEGLRYDYLFMPLFRAEVSATTPSFIFRKEYLAEIGFFSETKSFPDVDFILRLAQQVRGIVLYEPLFYRRLHDSNISSKDWEKGMEEGIELIHQYKNSLPREVVRLSLFRLYINYGEKYLKNKKGRKAITYFLKAWGQRPFSIVPLKKTVKAVLFSFRK